MSTLENIKLRSFWQQFYLYRSKKNRGPRGITRMATVIDVTSTVSKKNGAKYTMDQNAVGCVYVAIVAIYYLGPSTIVFSAVL